LTSIRKVRKKVGGGGCDGVRNKTRKPVGWGLRTRTVIGDPETFCCITKGGEREEGGKEGYMSKCYNEKHRVRRTPST